MESRHERHGEKIGSPPYPPSCAVAIAKEVAPQANRGAAGLAPGPQQAAPTGLFSVGAATIFGAQMIAADAFKSLLEHMGFQIVDITPHPYDDACLQLSKLTMVEVKSLWDQYDGCNDPGGFSGEELHFYLNLNGEGDHCAV